MALQEAVRKRLLPNNAAKEVKKPRVDKAEIRPFDSEQALQFLVAAQGDRLAAFYELALDSGARPGELLALQWPDLDVTARTIRITKSLEEIGYQFRIKPPKTKKGRRTIKLTARTVNALLAHRQRMLGEGRDVDQGFIFVNTEGGFVAKPSLFRNSYKKILKLAKLPHRRLYDLRHTSATLLLTHGANVKFVSERLGHEDIATTLKNYVHVLPSDHEQAIRIFDALFGKQPKEGPVEIEPGQGLRKSA
jgi:integrase